MKRIRQIGTKENAKKRKGTEENGGNLKKMDNTFTFFISTPVFVVFRFSHAWGAGAEVNVSSRMNQGYLLRVRGARASVQGIKFINL